MPWKCILRPIRRHLSAKPSKAGALAVRKRSPGSAFLVGAAGAYPRREILTAVDVAEISLAQGEGRAITQESMRQLADEVKQRGRNRLTAE